MRRRGGGRRQFDYPSSPIRRRQSLLTHSNSEQRPLFHRGQMLGDHIRRRDAHRRPGNAQSRRTDAGVGAAIACKNIGRKLATMTPMGVMFLPKGVAEVFLHCISCPCCSTSRRSRIRGRRGCPRRRSRRRGWGPRSSGDYPSSPPRRWQPFLTHSNSEQRPLFRRGQMLFHWRQYLASRCTSATR